MFVHMSWKKTKTSENQNHLFYPYGLGNEMSRLASIVHTEETEEPKYVTMVNKLIQNVLN